MNNNNSNQMLDDWHKRGMLAQNNPLNGIEVCELDRRPGEVAKRIEDAILFNNKETPKEYFERKQREKLDEDNHDEYMEEEESRHEREMDVYEYNSLNSKY